MSANTPDEVALSALKDLEARAPDDPVTVRLREAIPRLVENQANRHQSKAGGGKRGYRGPLRESIATIAHQVGITSLPEFRTWFEMTKARRSQQRGYPEERPHVASMVLPAQWAEAFPHEPHWCVFHRIEYGAGSWQKNGRLVYSLPGDRTKRRVKLDTVAKYIREETDECRYSSA